MEDEEEEEEEQEIPLLTIVIISYEPDLCQLFFALLRNMELLLLCFPQAIAQP